MPLTLSTPLQTTKPIVKQEIVQFDVDLVTMSARLTLANYDADGTVVSRIGGSVSLIANGLPRFDTKLYADIKTMLYKLAGEDGMLANGTIS